MKFLNSIILILFLLIPLIVVRVITHYVAKFLWPKTCSTLDGVASHHIDWHVAYRSTDYMKLFPFFVTYVILCLLFAPSLFFGEGILDRNVFLNRNVFLICYVAVGVYLHVLFPSYVVGYVFGQFTKDESAWWKWVIVLFCAVVLSALSIVNLFPILEGPVFIPLVSNFLLIILVAAGCSTQVSAIYFSEDKVLVCKNWLEPEYFLYEKTELQYSRKEKEISGKAEHSKYTCVTLQDVKQRKTVATFRLYEQFDHLKTFPCNREQVLAALQTLQEV